MISVFDQARNVALRLLANPNASSGQGLRLPVLGLLAAAAFAMPSRAGGQEGGMTWSEDPASKCHFVSPASLTIGPTFWVGKCIDGKASGFGMLRRRDGDRAGSAFYGELRDGVPLIGVIDDSDGYRVGAFLGGDIGGEAELEPQIRIDAFKAATKAAQSVSAKYADEKNQASAQHYETVAKTLDLQIE